MNTQDIRWEQRFYNYKRALETLEKAVEMAAKRPLNDLEEQGLIQGFEFTHELSWNLLKDYLEEKGFQDIHGSKDSTRLAFKEGLIENGEVWMDMIKDRNRSSHTYDEKTAGELVQAIFNLYISEFQKLRDVMNKCGSNT